MSLLKVASLTPLANAIDVELDRQMSAGGYSGYKSNPQANGDVYLDGEFNLFELASAIVAFQDNTTKQGVK